jgi:hypothetical protein
VATSYRKVLWILVFALLLAITEYGLAFQQSGHPHRSLVEEEFGGEPDLVSPERPAHGRGGIEPSGTWNSRP